MDFFKEAETISESIIKDRRYLHKNAETGFELHKTIDYVTKRLGEIGCSYSKCGKAGIKAVIGRPNTGGTILLRADMDALPFPEETDLPYHSQNGNMHACGHDLHTAMLLGAAQLLKNHEQELEGQVILMFQPAEETLEGAKDMIESGILKDPKPDCGVMIHVITELPIPTGTLILPKPGEGATAVRYFEIHLNGIGCHGASPHTGVDPITAASHLVIALQEIQSRELSASQKATLTIGAFNGGTAPNAIPAEVILKGSLRSNEEKTADYIKKRLEEMTESVAKTFRCNAIIKYTAECPVFQNNKTLIKDISKILQENKTLQIKQAEDNSGGGSEDFALVSQIIPSAMLVLTAGAHEDKYKYPQHHPMAEFDEQVLPLGAAIYAKIAIEQTKKLHNGE